MLHRDIIAVCSQIHTKHINTLCGQNVEFFNGKPGGTYSNHWVLKDSDFYQTKRQANKIKNPNGNKTLQTHNINLHARCYMFSLHTVRRLLPSDM